MGVTKDPRDIFYYDNNGDGFDQLENDINIQQSEAQGQKLKRRKKRYMSRIHVDNGNDMEMCSVRKRAGVKRSRRGENLRHLLNLVEKDEDCELDIDVFEPSMSVFAELFMEHDKMKVWNDFVNSSEEEQNSILQRPRGRQSYYPEKQETHSDSELDDSWEEIPDSRAVHPGFSAEECFQRIDKNIKGFLKRRHVPMGMLANFEEDVISFFKEWPTSVYISKLTSSFERMLLHALCQYLDLSSHSFNDGDKRQTQVENKHNEFCPPSILLTNYLQKSSS